MIGAVLVAAIAALHIYILVLEMFLWETPRAMKAFGTTPDSARLTRVLAANQGLYNGFLAAGLVWALARGVSGAGRDIALFFLGCVMIAGFYGAATANLRILYVQALPALFGLLAVWAHL
jgi:putative membrane protein